MELTLLTNGMKKVNFWSRSKTSELRVSMAVVRSAAQSRTRTIGWIMHDAKSVKSTLSDRMSMVTSAVLPERGKRFTKRFIIQLHDIGTRDQESLVGGLNQFKEGMVGFSQRCVQRMLNERDTSCSDSVQDELQGQHTMLRSIYSLANVHRNLFNLEKLDNRWNNQMEIVIQTGSKLLESMQQLSSGRTRHNASGSISPLK